MHVSKRKKYNKRARRKFQVHKGKGGREKRQKERKRKPTRRSLQLESIVERERLFTKSKVDGESGGGRSNAS